MADKINLGLIDRRLRRLKEMLELETGYLQARNTQDIAVLYEEKLELIQVLEEQKKLLKENKARGLLNEEEKAKLISFSKEMDKVIEKYGRELIKAREVNKYVMEAIAMAAQEHFKEVGAYDAKGNEGQYKSKGESTVPPMRVNNTF